MNHVVVVFFCCFLMAKKSFQKEVHCAFGSYPPSDKNEIPVYIINLDLPPKDRWTKLVQDKKSEIIEIVQDVKNLMGQFMNLVDIFFPYILKTLPSSYSDEIVGISEATGIPLGEIILYNLFYEAVKLCTSIVAQDKNGEIFHGRSLEFGLFMGWNKENRRWKATEILKRLVVNTEFRKNGQIVFRSVQFSGYVGILTGMKPNLFSLSINAKYELSNWRYGFLERILGFREGEWLGVLTRRVFENVNSYSEAQNTLTNARLLAPIYFILAGTKTGQGSIITRHLTSAHLTSLGVGNGNWFLVQTNYDHWGKPPFFDDRVTPATGCMNKLSQENLSLAGVAEVLTTKPLLSKISIHVTMMKPSEDILDTYIPECDEPCQLWG